MPGIRSLENDPSLVKKKKKAFVETQSVPLNVTAFHDFLSLGILV